MRNHSVKELIMSGLFIALGIVLPIIFHMIGAGTVFLPMHIPVLLSGFFVGVPFAIAVGILTPLLSSLLTGMPPMFPVLPFMMFELGTYGAITSLLYRKLTWNMYLRVYLSLIGSMIAGRISAAMAVWGLATFFAAKLPGPIVFITSAIVTGVPGIIIQLAIIPIIVVVIYNAYFKFARNEGSILE